MRLRGFAVALSLALALALAPATPHPQSSGPTLIVMLVVDQMRGDYIDQYGSQWNSGLRRMLDRGAWFRRAAYPYLDTVTCAGHSTLATGTFPATHGMVLNEWWDRERGRKVACTEDPSTPLVSYGKPVEGGNSPFRLLAPTLSDELKTQRQTPSRVVTFSLKERSAIALAGRRPQAATWFREKEGVFVTSSAYSRTRVPFIEQFMKARPVEADLGKVWTTAIPKAAYRFDDAASGERPPPAWRPAFPHPLKGRANQPDAEFFELWRRSPFSDAYLGKLAQAAVDALQLGRQGGLDFLGVSFSALDIAGHDFGPRSHEVQDILIRLDATIGALLSHLDRSVGADQYLVALSADHGVAPIPEQMAADGMDAGRLSTGLLVERVEKAIAPHLGPGRHVARMESTQVYFLPGVYQKLAGRPAALQAVVDTIRSTAGVARVLRAEELRDRRSGDTFARAAALSHYPGRSGDLIVVPKPYWVIQSGDGSSASNATTHGSLHPYDARVPVILLGPGVKRGRYDQPATPADLAPTLAALCGLTMPKAEGRVLAEALTTSSAARAR